MKKSLLFCLLVGLASPGFGQGRDTVFAIHKLFRGKRGTANALLATGDSAVSTTQYVQQDARRAVAVEKKPDALGSAVFYTAGTLKASQYSPEEEAAIIRRYNNGWSIPPNVRRKLKRKHFHRTTRDVLNK
jgi:hypothetical protein